MARPNERALKIPAALQLIAERFRAERMTERFGQGELAAEIGITRATVSNFEYGAARVTFAAGYAFCRRLDLNPRWLATGEEPKRPFIEPAELGVSEEVIKAQLRRGVDFLAGYDAALARPIASWLKKVPMEQIVLRQVEAGPAELARRLSMDELERKALEAVVVLKHDRAEMKLASVHVAQAMLSELRQRLETAYPRVRDILRRKR